jgi:hypothetical protein
MLITNITRNAEPTAGPIIAFRVLPTRQRRRMTRPLAVRFQVSAKSHKCPRGNESTCTFPPDATAAHPPARITVQ